MKIRPQTALILSFVLLAAAGAAQADHHMVPSAVMVPEGNVVMMNTLALGLITYECMEKKDAPGAYAWTFKTPHAYLFDSNNTQVGRYYGSPKGATWESNDGSKVVGKQLAVTPNTATVGSIPLQLVEQNGYEGNGAMNKVTYIQRLATAGGVAPTNKVCNAEKVGKKEIVTYQAEYVLWMAK